MRLLRLTLNRMEALFHSLSGKITLARSGVDAGTRVFIGWHVRLRATDGATALLGEDVTLSRFADITAKQGLLEIGARSFVGQSCIICAREAIRIGADCLIAEHVTIRDQDHRFGPGLNTAKAGFETAPVTIGNNVWIGAKATVTKGVTIGDNAVIGANSVVTQDIPANSLAVGAPARVIRAIGPPP